MLHDPPVGLLGVFGASAICLPQLRLVAIVSSAALTALRFELLPDLRTVSSISQAAAIAALDRDMGLMADWLARLRNRRDTLLTAKMRMTCATPPGSFYLFVDCTLLLGRTTPEGRVITTDADRATYLIEAANVGTVPSSAFGTAGYLPLAYAIDDALLETAIANLATDVTALHTATESA